MRQIDGETMQTEMWGGPHTTYVGNAQYGSAEPVAADVQVTNPVESVERVYEVDPAQQDFFAGNHNRFIAPVASFGGGVDVPVSTWNGQSEGFFSKLIRALTNAVKGVIPDAG